MNVYHVWAGSVEKVYKSKKRLTVSQLEQKFDENMPKEFGLVLVEHLAIYGSFHGFYRMVDYGTNQYVGSTENYEKKLEEL